MLFRKSVVTAVLLVLVLAWPIAACGGSGGGGASEIKVTATDFKYDPGDQTFDAGKQYKITMTNKGAVDHTWVLTDSAGKELTKLEVKVGATSSKTFTAPAAGNYNIICDIAGHKENGMFAKATVK